MNLPRCLLVSAALTLTAVAGGLHVAAPAVIEIQVTNPDFDGYRPHLLLRVTESGIQWSSLKRYVNSVPPGDLRAALGS